MTKPNVRTLVKTVPTIVRTRRGPRVTRFQSSRPRCRTNRPSKGSASVISQECRQVAILTATDELQKDVFERIGIPLGLLAKLVEGARRDHLAVIDDADA